MAFMAVSATLHGQIFQDVKRSLHYGSNVTVIKANANCQNVKYEVQVCNDIQNCYEELEFLLDFKKTVVYFNSVEDLKETYIHLMNKTQTCQPSFQQSNQITCYFADLALETKELYMLKFKHGKIWTLLSTEAAGMGCNISDILQVIQFRFPKNITVLAQCLGHVAHDLSLQGYGILIYLKTDNQGFKNMEAELYKFIRTDCFRKAFNDTFENEHIKITNCCDLCDRSLPVPSTSIKGRIQKAPPQ